MISGWLRPWILSDALWEWIEPLLPVAPGQQDRAEAAAGPSGGAGNLAHAGSPASAGKAFPRSLASGSGRTLLPAVRGW